MSLSLRVFIHFADTDISHSHLKLNQSHSAPHRYCRHRVSHNPNFVDDFGTEKNDSGTVL